ncbi:hypothetical protein [Kitasatospora phosalacinea]|uniref:hypothetical protein n=1 Tax=Kitasatospora phosalacinea TaxID=2065 RepID=UPI0005266277|nr:hypothetical protein [Kitasatospora phosalacinea]
MSTEQWEPREGRCAHDRRTGEDVRVMAVHSCGVFVRNLRDGRESVTTLAELDPPRRPEADR